MAKVARFDPGVDLNLVHSLIEDSDAATVPAYPDLVADKFGRNFIKGACHFNVTVAMDVASGFLEAGKERGGQRLQMGTFLFKAGDDLLARCPMDAFVSHLAFPLLEKEVLFAQGLEPPSLQCVGTYIGNSSLHLAFVLGLIGPARHDVESVMPTKVGQFGINFRIKPVRPEDRCF